MEKRSMLKNILIFIFGMVTMFVIVVILGIAVNSSSNSGVPGLTIFEKEGTCISAKQLHIFQTLAPDLALADAKSIPNSIYDPNEILVLLVGDENSNFYDDLKISISKGKCTRQIGTYQYETKMGVKTVPAVTIK